MISEMIAFNLVFGFLKMSGHIGNVFEKSKLSNYPSNIKQLGNIHISHKWFIIVACLPALHCDLHVGNVCDVVS